MTTFVKYVEDGSAVDFMQFDIADLVGPVVLEASPTRWRTGPNFIGSNYVEFSGTGFTYTAGNLAGGTIEKIVSVENGEAAFGIVGDFSMAAAAFQAFLAAGDTQGFLAAAFAGDDEIGGSSLDDHLLGYAGDDYVSG